MKNETDQCSSILELKTCQSIKEELTKKPVVFALIYGSYSNNEVNITALSDLDIALYLQNSLNKEERFEIRLNLISNIQNHVSPQVDLVIINDIPIGLKFRIFQTGTLIFCKDKTQFLDVKEKTLLQYFDFQPLERYIVQESLRI